MSRSTTSRAERRRPAAGSAPRTPAQRELTDLLVAYFAGERVTFADFDLAPTLAWAGVTPFEERCLRELQQVPYGETVSYGELARRAGRERAHRAAGSVCARGTLSIVVPYHRVIRADGSIGEWGPAGNAYKVRLLAHGGPAPVRGSRIVCLGGGTGLSTVLRGLKAVGQEPTAIVTLTDDGGSSGRLRRDLDIPPPGDVRACLVALAEDESFMGNMFQHRFSRGELAGHNLGNLFLAALTELAGSFDAAVALTSHALAIAGEVLPATRAAGGAGGRDGGRPRRGRRVGRRVGSQPRAPAAAGAARRRGAPDAVAAIERAELIVLGPGSLFTSTLPPLLVPAHPRRACCPPRPAACTSRTCSSSRARRSATTPRSTSTGSSSTSGRASSTRSSSRTSGGSRPTLIPVDFDRAQLARARRWR